MIEFTQHPEYEQLPEAVKHAYTPKEYAFMPEAQKKTLVADECLPDAPDDWEPAL